MMAAGIDLLDRIWLAYCAGCAVTAEDTREIGHAIGVALADSEGGGLDAALELPSIWRVDLARRIADRAAAEAVSTRPAPGGISHRARVFLAELELYHRCRFARDLKSRKRPSGPDGLHYEYLVSRKGELPSERTVRRQLAKLAKHPP